jgi:hypothetical protein
MIEILHQGADESVHVHGLLGALEGFGQKIARRFGVEAEMTLGQINDAGAFRLVIAPVNQGGFGEKGASGYVQFLWRMGLAALGASLAFEKERFNPDPHAASSSAFC